MLEPKPGLINLNTDRRQPKEVKSEVDGELSNKYVEIFGTKMPYSF